MTRRKRSHKNSSHDISKKIVVVKVGGSVYDRVYADPNNSDFSYLEELATELVSLSLRDARLVVTVGGGRHQEASREDRAAIGMSRPEYVARAENDLKTNAITLASILKRALQKVNSQSSRRRKKKANKKIITILDDDRDFSKIAVNGFLRTHIPIVPWVPYSVLTPLTNKRDDRSQSDVHTVGLGEYLASAASRQNSPYTNGVYVVFAKDVPSKNGSVHKFDPNCKVRDQSTNESYKLITIEEFLDPSVIDRRGPDGDGGHLMEDRAGRIFRDNIRYLKRIGIVSCHLPRKCLRKMIYDGHNTGTWVINKMDEQHPDYVHQTASAERAGYNDAKKQVS